MTYKINFFAFLELLLLAEKKGITMYGKVVLIKLYDYHKPFLVCLFARWSCNRSEFEKLCPLSVFFRCLHFTLIIFRFVFISNDFVALCSI